MESACMFSFGAIAEYPAQAFTCGGVLWRTRYITIVAILIQWDANGWVWYSAIKPQFPSVVRNPKKNFKDQTFMFATAFPVTWKFSYKSLGLRPCSSLKCFLNTECFCSFTYTHWRSWWQVYPRKFVWHKSHVNSYTTLTGVSSVTVGYDQNS